QNPLKLEFLSQFHSQFPTSLKRSLTRAAQHQGQVGELAVLHHDLGRFYAKEIVKHSKNLKVSLHLIGLHGQTIFHQPPQATLQIGEPSYISVATGVPVVSDFRVADLALHGQGAPLATVLHAALMAHLISKESVAVHNLGGISNVSFFEKGSIKNLKQVRG